MALHGNMLLAPAGGYSGYQIDQSMVLDDGSSQYLSRTFSSPTDNNVWTLSFWFKPGAIDTGLRTIFGSQTGTIDRVQFGATAYKLSYSHNAGAAQRIFDDVFRDPGAWYHIVLAVNTDASSSNRVRGWKNGIEMTSTGSEPGSGAATGINAAVQHNLGRDNGSQYFDGYIAEVHFLDGTAVTDATDFGEFYNGGNQWRGIQPSGLTYGTNGFYLPFTQDTPNLGVDYSGNGNDWTENGSGPVQSSDSPTVNYCTFNTLDKNSAIALSNGNRTGTKSTGGYYHNVGLSCSPSGGKFYIEFDVDTVNGETQMVGVHTMDADLSANGISGPLYDSGWCWTSDGDKRDAGTTSSSWGTAWSTNDVVQLAIDATDLTSIKVWYGLNNTWQSSGDPGAGTNASATITEEVKLAASVGYVTGQLTLVASEDDWTYSAPDGFVALSAANLPEATITDPGEYFNAVAYTGDGTAIGSGGNSITGIGFQSDFTWIKNRDATDSHMLFDVIRGATKVLHSNEITAETTESETLTSFDSDGFRLGSDVEVNTNTEDYVSWNWKAGGAGVANTDGTISSTVSVNDDAGFSIVSYTGTGSAATVGHGQSAAPEMIIVKNRDQADAWAVYHSGIASDAETDYLVLNTTAAAVDNNTWWNDTAPTASVFSIGTAVGVNTNTEKFIAYCFRSIPGYSKVFSYTGNSSSDGAFVYLGFRAKFLLIKGANVAHEWLLWDVERSTFNVVDDVLSPNASYAESVNAATRALDILSNGFKARTSNETFNSSSYNYVGIAFAENPFGGSNLPLGLAR